MEPLRSGDRGPEVEELQLVLSLLEYHADPDGAFGPQTEAALRTYQGEAGLVSDGVCGPDTRSALRIDRHLRTLPEWRAYRGSLGVLVREEGFDGAAHWPGGASGVTLDRGFDLRWQPKDRLLELYGELWGEASCERLATACGLAGTRAQQWLQHARKFAWVWPISRDEADAILPRAALPYWIEALRAWPELEHLPGPIQTAALSVCYSAWSAPLARARRAAEGPHSDLSGAAHAIRQAPGDPSRRAREAQLVEGSLRG